MSFPLRAPQVKPLPRYQVGVQVWEFGDPADVGGLVQHAQCGRCEASAGAFGDDHGGAHGECFAGDRRMGHAGVMSRYAEARLYVVPESLEELAGPTEGLVRLPRYLDWGPAYEYELADAADLAVMYERILREARSREDLEAYLDDGTLRRLWGQLVLPAPVRALWECRFPELAARRAAAA